MCLQSGRSHLTKYELPNFMKAYYTCTYDTQALSGVCTAHRLYLVYALHTGSIWCVHCTQALSGVCTATGAIAAAHWVDIIVCKKCLKTVAMPEVSWLTVSSFEPSCCPEPPSPHPLGRRMITMATHPCTHCQFLLANSCLYAMWYK